MRSTDQMRFEMTFQFQKLKNAESIMWKLWWTALQGNTVCSYHLHLCWVMAGCCWFYLYLDPGFLTHQKIMVAPFLCWSYKQNILVFFSWYFQQGVEVQFREWSLSWCVFLQTDHKMYFSSPSAESFVQQAQVPCMIRRIKLCSWTSLFQVFFGSIAKFLSELWSGCYNSSFHDSKNSLKIDLSPCSHTDEVMRMRS